MDKMDERPGWTSRCMNNPTYNVAYLYMPIGPYLYFFVQVYFHELLKELNVL
jgi:hypothetical protein